MQYLIKLTAIHTHSLYLTPSIIVEDSNFSFRFIIQKDVFFFFGFLFWVRVFVHTELASVGASRSLQFFFFLFSPISFFVNVCVSVVGSACGSCVMYQTAQAILPFCMFVCFRCCFVFHRNVPSVVVVVHSWHIFAHLFDVCQQ